MMMEKEPSLNDFTPDEPVTIGSIDNVEASMSPEVDPKLALVQQREDFLLALRLRLRTPVLANKTTLTDLLNGEYGSLNEQQQSIMRLLIDNNQEIDRLISMLVSLYRFRNGNIELQKSKHSLSSFFKDLSTHRLGCVGANARGEKISISVHDGGNLEVACDAEQLQQLLGHLFDNALKHAKSSVVVEATKVNDHLLIAVEDDGPGIQPDDVQDLFQRFYYVSKSGEYSPTTGVGLCLCAEIARAHGGKISYERSSSGGAKFSVSLPLQ